MAGRSKLLVLGIDAASPELLRRWAATGALPALRDLFERSTTGTVRGVDGFFVGSTWPSFYTGLGPAGHGFHRIDQLRSGTYEFFRPLASEEGTGGTPFWRRASDAGRRVAVVDVPLSRPEPGLNGLQVVEWGGHDAVFGFRTTPPGLAHEILESVGPYPLRESCDRERRTARDFEAYVRRLEHAVQRKKALTLDLLGRDDWDLFVQVFTEAHCAGHQLWHLHDRSHPAFDPDLAEKLGDPLQRVYRAIDGAVEAILERAGADRVLLLSAHGMSYYRGASFLLPEILFRLGVTARPRGGPPPSPGLAGHAAGAARWAWERIPEPVRAALRPALRPLRAADTDGYPADGSDLGVPADVTRSQCFPVPNGAPVGAIRLNLAGREPRGVLRRGSEAEGFCRELAESLRAVVDERTGEPLVAEVHRTDELHAGPRRDALPDLLVEWNGATPTGSLAHGDGRGATVRASSPTIGTVEEANGYVRTGDHVPTGLFALAGRGVPAARREEPLPLVDLHPTICRLLGLPEPDVDGTAAPDLVAPTTAGAPPDR